MSVQTMANAEDEYTNSEEVAQFRKEHPDLDKWWVLNSERPLGYSDIKLPFLRPFRLGYIRYLNIKEINRLKAEKSVFIDFDKITTMEELRPLFKNPEQIKSFGFSALSTSQLYQNALTHFIKKYGDANKYINVELNKYLKAVKFNLDHPYYDKIKSHKDLKNLSNDRYIEFATYIINQINAKKHLLVQVINKYNGLDDFTQFTNNYFIEKAQKKQEILNKRDN
jgi:hypothetical protein